MSVFPKWDGESKPPINHVVAHRLLGPLVAGFWALKDALREGKRTFLREYDAVRSWHADRWRRS